MPGVEELVERRRKFFFGHLGAVDVELLEEGLVEHPSGLAIRLPIERLWVPQEVQPSPDDLGPGLQAVVEADELLLQPVALLPNRRQSGTQTVLGDLGIGGEIEEVVLFDRERLETRAGALGGEVAPAPLLAERLFEHRGDLLDEGLRHLEGGVAPQNRVLDLVDGDVRVVAEVLLPRPAEEVPVLAAVPPEGALQHHAADAPLLRAAGAHKRAFEVVVVNAAALRGGAVGVKNALHPREERL